MRKKAHSQLVRETFYGYVEETDKPKRLASCFMRYSYYGIVC